MLQSVHLPVNTQFTLVPLILASISYSKLKLGTNIQWIQWQTLESYVDPCGIGENKLKKKRGKGSCLVINDS